jgi:hypothetical protein
MGLEEALDSNLSEVGGAKLVVFAVDARIGQHVAGISGNALKQDLVALNRTSRSNNNTHQR